MSLSRRARWVLFVVGSLLLLGIAGLGAMHFAARSLKEHVLAALGPESEITDLRIGFTSIVITGVRVPPPKGWPAADPLRAERVVILPDLRQLLSREIYINNVRIENAYISAVRPKEGGGLKVLPGIMNKAKKGDAEKPTRAAEIARVELDNCTIELFDQSIGSRQKMRVDAVQGTITDIEAPSMKGRSKIDLKGLIKGPAHQGTISVAGWVEVAKKRSETTTIVRNVDLTLFEPYLIQKTKAGIGRGTFNLDLKASVHNNMITAPGTLTLNGLHLESGEGLSVGFPTFLGKQFLPGLPTRTTASRWNSS